MVLDLEDAVADHEVESARANAVDALDKIASTDAVGMLLFVRVREVADIHKVAASLTEGRAALTGFVIPK
ncbi:aldolase/citrate lyase family protein, partial [Rhodococcus erythropolis]|nr:aldolase/citrate lyase family protein [Rhodococcus erythropolis]